MCFDASPHTRTQMMGNCSMRVTGPVLSCQRQGPALCRSAVHTGCRAQGKLNKILLFIQAQGELVLATLSKEFYCSCMLQGPRKTSITNTSSTKQRSKPSKCESKRVNNSVKYCSMILIHYNWKHLSLEWRHIYIYLNICRNHKSVISKHYTFVHWSHTNYSLHQNNPAS